MRPTLAAPLGLALALALASSSARADPPRTVIRLEYARGQGAETCPATPAALRAEVAQHWGYDPFDVGDVGDVGDAAAPERMVVTLSRHGRGFAARIERYNRGGVLTWSEVFPGTGATCAALVSPLATELRALLLTFQGPPGRPPREPAAPAPAPPPAVVAPPAPAVGPVKLPEPASVPNPARDTASRVAIVFYAAAGVFLGLSIAWSVDAANKGASAQALAAQLRRRADLEGNVQCAKAGAVSGGQCDQLFEGWQTRDRAVNVRNAWLGAAGLSAGAGIIATAFSLTFPATIKQQPQAKVRITPGGLTIAGSF